MRPALLPHAGEEPPALLMPRPEHEAAAGTEGRDVPACPLLQAPPPPAAIIAHRVWPYLRFSLSLRAVEEMLLERGVEVSHKKLRRWVAEFGPRIARGLRRRQARPGEVRHLDEVQLTIRGRRFRLRRAVDEHGLVLEGSLRPRGDRKAAERLLRRLPKTVGGLPKRIVTDKLASYSRGQA